MPLQWRNQIWQSSKEGAGKRSVEEGARKRSVEEGAGKRSVEEGAGKRCSESGYTVDGTLKSQTSLSACLFPLLPLQCPLPPPSLFCAVPLLAGLSGLMLH